MVEILIRKYLRAVKKEVRCSAKRKRTFLADLENGLRELSQETPDLTMEQLIEAFGTPQQQARDFMETLDATEIKRAFGWKKIVLIGVLAVVLIWLITVVSLWIEGLKSGNGYSVEEEYKVTIAGDGSYTEYNGDGTYGIMKPKNEKKLSGSTNAKEKTKEFVLYDSDGNKLWSISITASFTYNGTTATCISVSEETTVFDSSWKCKESSCSKIEDTALGDFTLKHYVGLKVEQSHERTLTLTCDPNGNIT